MLGLGKVLFFVFLVAGGNLQACKDAGLDEKACFSKLWAEREAVYVVND